MGCREAKVRKSPKTDQAHHASGPIIVVGDAQGFEYHTIDQKQDDPPDARKQFVSGPAAEPLIIGYDLSDSRGTFIIKLWLDYVAATNRAM